MFLTGKEFNEMFADKSFYKLLNDDCVHHDFLYQDGLNTDTQKHGINFIDKENIFNRLNDKHLYFCEVKITDDSYVYVEAYPNSQRIKNCKSKSLILDFSKKMKICDLPEWSSETFCKDFIKKCSSPFH